MIKKAYQEEEGSSFESNGVLYDLNGIFRDTANNVVTHISPHRLKWCLAKTDDRARIARADVGVPILVTMYKGRALVVDGMHRALHAIELNLFSIPCKWVSAAVMEKHVINN